MTVLMSLFDFNEFIRYLALMEAAAEELARGHNKWKAVISVEWAEKKRHSSWLASSCALLWVAVTRTLEPGVLVPLDPRWVASGPALTERLPAPRSEAVNASVRRDSWITFRGTESFTLTWPRTLNRGVGVSGGAVPRPGLVLAISKH